MKPTFVFDATPLIYLSKARIISKIAFLQAKNILLPSVHREVVETGAQRGEEDVSFIQRCIEQGILVIEELRGPSLLSLRENRRLSDTDREVLSFCKQQKAMLIADDEEIRTVAEIENIPCHGSIYILFRLLEIKKITKSELKQILHTMINQGWYCSIELYVDILEQLEQR